MRTPIAIGMEYQNAAALIVAKMIKICSVPYATDESASEESIAKAFNFVSFCSPAA